MQIMGSVFLVLYFAIVVGISLWKRKVDSEADYFLAGRSLGAKVLGFTFVASWFGGASALTSVDQAFKNGISAWWVIGGPAVVAAAVLLIFSAGIRKVGSISQPEIMGKRYNRKVRLMLSIFVTWYMVTWAASQMVAAGKFVGGFYGINYTWAILLSVTLVVIYSIIGGFRAVVLTDVFLFFLLGTSMVIAFIIATTAGGGMGSIVAAAPAKGGNFLNLFADFRTNVFYLLSFALAWIIEADVWQRLIAAKTVSHAKRITGVALAIFIPLYIITVLTGMAAASLFKEFPKEGIMNALMTQFMNPALAAFMFIGIAAAIMSTLDTALNTGSLTITHDIYVEYINPHAEEKQIVRVGMLGTALVAILAFIVAIRLPDILWVLWMASDIVAAGAFTPLILGFIWKRGNSAGALASMIAGGGFVLYNYLHDLGVPLPTFWEGWPYHVLYAFILGTAAYFIVSLMTPAETEKAEKFMAEVNANDSMFDQKIISS